MSDRAQTAESPAITVRGLMRSVGKAALGTLRPPEGRPFVSLVLVATTLDCAPLLLLSQLAVHTQNLTADAHASLLFDGTDGSGDPLSGARATVEGSIEPVDNREYADRFLRRHPEAAGYASFKDFRFYRLVASRAHLVAGFGRIVEVEGAQLAQGCDISSPDWRTEGQAAGELSTDLGVKITLLDPEGFGRGTAGEASWTRFPRPAKSLAEARAMVVDIVQGRPAR